MATKLKGRQVETVSQTEAGVVPATGIPSNKFLRDDLTWQTPAGSGGGYSSSINNISINTTLSSSGTTIYYYFCTGTITITLPTAVGNTDIYVIKNVGTGFLTINTTSSQTVDGSLTQTIYFQNTSVDIKSNNVNWFIS